MRKGKIRNKVNGMVIDVIATTDHPDSHYGRAVWVDKDNYAYMEVNQGVVKNPFYEVVEDSGEE